MLNRLLSFLDASPVNFLAVEQIRLRLGASAQVDITEYDSTILRFPPRP